MADGDELQADGEGSRRDPDFAFRPRAPSSLLAAILIAAPIWSYATVTYTDDAHGALLYCHVYDEAEAFTTIVGFMFAVGYAWTLSGFLGLAVACRWPRIGALVPVLIPVVVAYRILAVVPSEARALGPFGVDRCAAGAPDWWPWWFPR